MKVIINKLIPIKGYVAMTTWPFIFARKELSKYVRNHEEIHGKQQKELAIIMFYIIYILEYIIKLCITFNHDKAYASRSFEQEANIYEHDLNYISTRRNYALFKYVFKIWK